MRKRSFLVGTHQTAVARDIRAQNSCQPPLYVLAAQDARPSSWKLNGIYQNCGPMSRYAQVRNCCATFQAVEQQRGYGVKTVPDHDVACWLIIPVRGYGGVCTGLKKL